MTPSVSIIWQKISQNSRKYYTHDYSSIIKDTIQEQPNEMLHRARSGMVSDTELYPWGASGYLTLLAQWYVHQPGRALVCRVFVGISLSRHDWLAVWLYSICSPYPLPGGPVAEGSSPLATCLVFLMTSFHPEATWVPATSHFINITKALTTQKIPMVFESLSQEPETKTRYSLSSITESIFGNSFSRTQ